jgi:hypothetical protein
MHTGTAVIYQQVSRNGIRNFIDGQEQLIKMTAVNRLIGT